MGVFFANAINCILIDIIHASIGWDSTSKEKLSSKSQCSIAVMAKTRIKVNNYMYE